MDWLVGALWAALALAVVLLDRTAWQAEPGPASDRRTALDGVR
jgi:hypothetical protein